MEESLEDHVSFGPTGATVPPENEFFRFHPFMGIFSIPPLHDEIFWRIALPDIQTQPCLDTSDLSCL